MRGFTLVELIISIMIFSIIISVGVPSFLNMQDRFSTDFAKGRMQKTLLAARAWALANRKPIIVCPMLDGKCSSSWNDPLTSFYDKNDNLSLDDDELLIFQLPDHSPRGSWSKKKEKQNYIKFNAQGHAFSSATTLLYCPDSGNHQNAKQLIISFQGRIRSNNYLSSRGTPYASLAPLQCQ
jgi:type IV fimbrial biogenesis protein FimT